MIVCRSGFDETLSFRLGSGLDWTGGIFRAYVRQSPADTTSLFSLTSTDGEITSTLESTGDVLLSIRIPSTKSSNLSVGNWYYLDLVLVTTGNEKYSLLSSFPLYCPYSYDG